MIETSLSSWFCVKAKFFQWAKKPLPTTRKRNLRRIFFFPTFFSFKMLAPGKPEQVEIFPRERLPDQIGHGCLQPLNHSNLNLGEVWMKIYTQKTFFAKKNAVIRSFDNNKSMPVFSLFDWQHLVHCVLHVIVIGTLSSWTEEGFSTHNMKPKNNLITKSDKNETHQQRKEQCRRHQ